MNHLRKRQVQVYSPLKVDCEPPSTMYEEQKMKRKEITDSRENTYIFILYDDGSLRIDKKKKHSVYGNLLHSIGIESEATNALKELLS